MKIRAIKRKRIVVAEVQCEEMINANRSKRRNINRSTNKSAKIEVTKISSESKSNG
jgi:hypothetical protein